MRTPCHSFPSLRDAIAVGGTPPGCLIGADHRTALGDLLQGSVIASGVEHLRGHSVLLTSGTTGRPKMVLHTLASLAGAIGASASHTEVIWSTFYDIRRYGGLQIYLRAVLTRSSLVLTGPQELVANFLRRAGETGITH